MYNFTARPVATYGSVSWIMKNTNKSKAITVFAKKININIYYIHNK